MIIDTCTFVGRHPFSRLHCYIASDLVRRMERAEIDRALVTPLAGAFYQNAQEANEEALHSLGKNDHRLTLLAALNPSYPGWEKDLKRIGGRLHAAGIRLFPGYHAYTLDSPEVSSLADTAGKMGLPVFISIRLWDERQHPPICMVPAVPWKSVADLAVAHPKTNFVLSMGRFGEVVGALKETSAAGNLYADIAGIQGPQDCMRKLIAEVGSERLLFGTEALLQYALPARYKIDYGGLSEQDRGRVYHGNLMGILESVKL